MNAGASEPSSPRRPARAVGRLLGFALLLGGGLYVASQFDPGPSAGLDTSSTGFVVAAAPAAPAAPTPAPGRLVIVVDADGTPIPGATVDFVVEEAAATAEREGAVDSEGSWAPFTSSKVFVPFAPVGTTSTAGDGSARVPWTSRDLRLRARFGDLRGESRVTADSTGPYRVAIKAVAKTSLAVVDRAGRPVARALVAIDRTTAAGETVRSFRAADASGTIESVDLDPASRDVRASLVAFDGLAARSVRLGPEPARLEVDETVGREFRLTFPDGAPPRVRISAKDGAFVVVAAVPADGVVPFVTGPGAFVAVVAPEFGLRAPLTVRSGPDGATDPATFSEAAAATHFESLAAPAPAVRLHVAARLTTTRAGSGPGPWFAIADPPSLPLARGLELPWGEDSEGLGFEVIAVAAEEPTTEAPSAVAVAWTNVMAIDDPTRGVGLGPRTLRPVFFVDVIDSARNALPGVRLDMTFDEPCLLRREDGRFEPGKPSTTWSVRSDESGRFLCYADRAATHFFATWSLRDDSGAWTNGSGTWSGSPLLHAEIEAR